MNIGVAQPNGTNIGIMQYETTTPPTTTGIMTTRTNWWGDICWVVLFSYLLLTGCNIKHDTNAPLIGSRYSPKHKYHYSWCKWAKKISPYDNRIDFKDACDAEQQGYSPCSICNPKLCWQEKERNKK